MASLGLGSDVSNDLSTIFNTWKLPDISSLHNVIRTGINSRRAMQTLFLQGYSSRTFRHSNEAKLRKAKGRRRSSGVPVLTKNGGAERDRTADPLLAKQVLSQLSYSPNRSDHLPDPRMVGPGRLELPTSRLSGVRSNHLSYGPIPVARTT